MVGFARSLMQCGVDGQSERAALGVMHKKLGRRLFTQAGRSAAYEPREKLREMIGELRRALDDG